MKKQSGFSLVELMIALLIGLIIVAATITLYATTVKSGSDTIKSARLNHDLEAAMTLMVNDIRRAGYWGGAIKGSNAKVNPFTSPTTDINLPAASCILYTYDGALDDGIVGNNEHYGFRLNANGAILIRTSGSTTATCPNNDDNWVPFTDDSQVNITGLSFTTALDENGDGTPDTGYKCLNTSKPLTDPPPTPLTANTNPALDTCAAMGGPGALVSGDTAVESREIQITLTGQLTDDPTVTKTLTDFVTVRNDRIFTQP